MRGDIVRNAVWSDTLDFAHNPGAALSQPSTQVEKQAMELVPLQAEQGVIDASLEAKQAERQMVISLARKGLISEVEA